MEIIAALIGLISLITFFVMAAALANISANLKNINRVLNAWSNETGIGRIAKCIKCKKTYTGKPSACPHCGDEKVYLNS